MKRTFLLGLCTAVIGGLGLLIAGAIGLSFQNTVLGVGIGVIAAVVRVGAPIWRLAGIIVGIFLGVFFDAMELGLLPGGASVAGTAVSLAIILALVTIISGVTSNRVPLWSMILGALGFVGGFVPVIATAPWTARAELPIMLATSLVLAGIGFFAVLPAELLPERRKGQRAGQGDEGPPSPPKGRPEKASLPISEMIGGAK